MQKIYKWLLTILLKMETLIKEQKVKVYIYYCLPLMLKACLLIQRQLI